MKVAVNMSPAKNAHKYRGIGSYTHNLQNALTSLSAKDVEFEFFSAETPKADVVHYPFFDLFFRTLNVNSGVKTVVTIHDVIPLVFPQHFPVGIKGFINLFFQKRALNSTDAVICDSKTSKEDIISKLSYPSEKIHVIYLAPGENFRKIDEKKKKVISKKLKLPEEFFLYVGDVNWNKNLPALLRAVELSKVNLVMAGQSLTDAGLPQTKELDNLIESLKIQKKIFKTGFVKEEDLIGIYNLAKATISPSLYEGFGLPVLESMACGTPVICSKVSSLAEISDNVSIFCDPTSPEDIAGKITEVQAIKENALQTLSKALREHASKYTWENVALKTLEVYKSV
jgi:glycosyltransferase involved in cell wall biosynthesis